MPLINPTLPSDGESADAVDISGPIQAILAVLNGNIDEDNIALGSLSWAVFATLTNVIEGDAMKDNANIRISRDETLADHIASGLVVTADAVGSSLNYSTSTGIVYINGRRLSIAADTARAAAASQDTYVYATDNNDGTGSLSRLAVSNNGTSPSLPSRSILIGIVVAGASSVSSVNIGSPEATAPTVSSNVLAVTDSLGNLIRPTTPNPILIGYRQIITDFSQSSLVSNQYYDVTGLSCPAIIPAGRRVRIRAWATAWSTSVGSPPYMQFAIREGSTFLSAATTNLTTNTIGPWEVHKNTMPSAGLHTYKLSLAVNQGGGAFSLKATDNQSNVCPVFVSVELV